MKSDGTRAETRFRLSAKRTSPFKSAGASVQSTTDSRGVHISGSNAKYTMYRGSVKSIGYPLHSPVSPSLPLPCVTVCHHISIGLYNRHRRWLKATDHTYQQGSTSGLPVVSRNVTGPHVSCTVSLARYAWLRTALKFHLQWAIVRSNHGRVICCTDWGMQSFHRAPRPSLPFPTLSPSVTNYSTLNLLSLTLSSPIVI